MLNNIDKISVYLISGNLGSGKTTFISSLSKTSKFKNSFIVENEFANHGVDKNVLSDFFNEDNIIDINGGCICCSTGNELILAFDKIKKINFKNYPVIIETTGVASSVQVLRKLFLSDIFNQSFQIKSNILIIDLLEDNIENLTNKINEIKLADKIILSKNDLVDQAKRTTLVEFIESLNENAELFFSNKGLFDYEKFSENSNSYDEIINNNFKLIMLNNSIIHKDEISYEIIDGKLDFSKEEFEKRINEIFRMNKIFRIKGDFLDKFDQTWHIEATPNNIDIKKLAKKSNSYSIVFIGENLSKLNI